MTTKHQKPRVRVQASAVPSAEGFAPLRGALRHMRGFYRAFPIREALRRELSWTHYRLLLRVDSAERVRQGGHHIEEAVIRRRFVAGRRNLEQAYKSAVDSWAEYDNVGEEPTLLQWGENP